jgi:phosphoenolpyruvate carboxylase
LVDRDIRQNSERHVHAFDALTRYYGLGSYASRSEADKQAFLLRELNDKRSLFANDWQPEDEVRAVLDTCALVARQDWDVLGSYVVSMASHPSGVLAVVLLLKEPGVGFPRRVVPLFETLADLDSAPGCVDALLGIDWYCQGARVAPILGIVGREDTL